MLDVLWEFCLLIPMYACCQCSVYQDTFCNLELAESKFHFFQLKCYVSALYFVKVSPHLLNVGFPVFELLSKKPFLLREKDGGWKVQPVVLQSLLGSIKETLFWCRQTEQLHSLTKAQDIIWCLSWTSENWTDTQVVLGYSWLQLHLLVSFLN